MKKYFFSFFALIVAVCLLSFTHLGKTKNTQLLYWFEYENGVVGAQIGTGAIEKHQATTLECPDVSGVDCARGYASPVDPGSFDNPELDDIQKSE